MALPLTPLSEETWGERFLRARRRSGVRLDDAAERISQVWPTSYATLTRLEQMEEAPADKRRRAIALLALIVYGVDPKGFGLTLEDVPPAIDRDKLRTLLFRPERLTNDGPASDVPKRQKPCSPIAA